MARKSGLSIVAAQAEPEAQDTQASEPKPAETVVPAADSRTRVAKPASDSVKAGSSRYAGQFHVGASYDENDDTVEAFRTLAFKSRRSQKDLLHEAMQLLVDKHDPFGKR